MTPEDFSEVFEPLDNRKLAESLNSKLLNHFRIHNKVKKVEFNNEYMTTEGQGGYEKNKIYTFSGIKIYTIHSGNFLFQKGDYWRMPKKETPNSSQIFGFELNIDPKGKVEEAFFITKSCFSLDELKNHNNVMHTKIAQIKSDQQAKKSVIGRLLKNMPII